MKPTITKTNTDEIALKKRTMYTLPIGLLMPDPENVRNDYGDIDALAQDVAEKDVDDVAKGVKQPLLVRRGNGITYIVSDGHRRLMAAQIANDKYGAGIEGLPCLLEDKGTAPEDRLLGMLSAGIHAKPLTPTEEGKAYRKALEGFKMNKADLARKIGKSVAYIDGCMAIAADEALAGLNPTAAAKLTKVPRSRAREIVAGGARNAADVERATTGQPKPVGKVALRREYQRLEKLEVSAPVLLTPVARGYMLGLAFARGTAPALELEAA
jgi:ParB/RepB/Spo0J family partition protein